jgi:hypothetical protein
MDDWVKTIEAGVIKYGELFAFTAAGGLISSVNNATKTLRMRDVVFNAFTSVFMGFAVVYSLGDVGFTQKQAIGVGFFAAYGAQPLLRGLYKLFIKFCDNPVSFIQFLRGKNDNK